MGPWPWVACAISCQTLLRKEKKWTRGSSVWTETGQGHTIECSKAPHQVWQTLLSDLFVLETSHKLRLKLRFKYSNVTSTSEYQEHQDIFVSPRLSKFGESSKLYRVDYTSCNNVIDVQCTFKYNNVTSTSEYQEHQDIFVSPRFRYSENLRISVGRF